MHVGIRFHKNSAKKPIHAQEGLKIGQMRTKRGVLNNYI